MINEAKIKQLHRIAIEILGGLEDEFPQYERKLAMVHFSFSGRMTRAAGNARPHLGLIRFSSKIWSIESNSVEEFKNTVLHEVAHILAGAGQGHNSKWRRIAIEIGCTGERCHRLATPPRKPRQEWPCRVCGSPLTLGPRQIQSAKAGRRSYRHSTCKPIFSTE